MIRDTIPYIDTVGDSVTFSSSLIVQNTIPYADIVGDSVISKDTVSYCTFSFEPIKGEIADITERQLALNTTLQQDEIPDVIRYSGQRLPFNLQSDGIFSLLLVCFFFLSHLYGGGISFLKENIPFLFSPQKAFYLHGQTTVKEVLYNYLLVLQSVVLIAICIYDIFIEFEIPGESNGRLFITITGFIILIALFFKIKDWLYKIIGYIFDQQKAMNYWRRTYMVSIEILGILYFIPTLLLIYLSSVHIPILIFMLTLFLIIQVTLFYQIIVFFISQKFNFLYLIAYLCTFEILPYIFLSIGLIYLYKTDVFNTLLWP